MRGVLGLLALCAAAVACHGNGDERCATARDCDVGEVCSRDRATDERGACLRAIGPCGGASCAAGFHCDDRLALCVAGATECATTASCPDGQTCAGGRCACERDDACPPGERCSGGRCAPKPCDSDGACATGQICEGQACVAGCRSARDCSGAAARCDVDAGAHGACVECLADGDCQQPERCVAGACRLPCVENGDCELGEVCIGGGCTAGCDRDRDCPSAAPRCDLGGGVYGACVAVCHADDDCDGDEVCDEASGRCEECLQNGDCGLGRVCRERRCEPGCDGDRDCPAELSFCSAGHCVACRGPSDCGGAACTDGECANATVKLDLLFVVDNSADMLEEQDRLVAAVDDLVAALGSPRPSLHVGVVSTDLGTPPYPSTTCVDNGDGGALLVAPTLASCAPPKDGARYIVDLPVDGGGRMTNYDGAIESAFGCIAHLGEDGCGVEMPLASMRRALDGSVAANSGFLRADAHLMVIILSNEDDCSTRDPSLWVPTSSEAIGPFSGFRCVEFGVTCDGQTIARAAGSYTSCAPRGDSYLYGTAPYVDFLRGLKAAPRIAFVAAIAGPPTPFMVEVDAASRPQLAHSCPGADPAVRLQAFVAAFGDRGHFASSCASDYAPGLTEVAAAFRRAIGR